jgi:DNA-binding MarR family transcriptional regulator
MLNDFSDNGCDTTAEEFTDLMTRLLNNAALIEREPVDTGDGVLLHTSEIHVIDMAGRFPDDSMTALALRLGITKGALSQTVKKLEEKEYVERVSPKGNNKTMYIRLTGTGMRAFSWHRAYHAAVNKRIARQVAGLGQKERDAIRNVLFGIEKVFDDCAETRRRITQELAEGGSTSLDIDSPGPAILK